MQRRLYGQELSFPYSFSLVPSEPQFALYTILHQDVQSSLKLYTHYMSKNKGISIYALIFTFFIFFLFHFVEVIKCSMCTTVCNWIPIPCSRKHAMQSLYPNPKLSLSHKDISLMKYLSETR